MYIHTNGHQPQLWYTVFNTPGNIFHNSQCAPTSRILGNTSTHVPDYNSVDGRGRQRTVGYMQGHQRLAPSP